MKVYADVNGREAYVDASEATVEVSCGETVTIEKMFGPLVFFDIRVIADFESGDWIIEREHGDGSWHEAARIPGQSASDFADVVCADGHVIREEDRQATDELLPCGCPSISAEARMAAGLPPLAALTRDDVVAIAQAVEEFRDEYSGPHLDANQALAERIRSVLGASGERFVLEGVQE